jgi:hypothetical protein
VYHNYKLGDSSQLSSFTGYAESPSELGLVSALDTRLRGYDINLYLSDINLLIPNPDKPERIATKAPRHKEKKMFVLIKLRVLVS